LARCYDADGNQTSTRSSGDCSTGTLVETFTWDATNRLTAYDNDTTGADVVYVYDPFGRRIKKSGTSGTTFYLWDGDRLLAEYDNSGSRQVRYAYAGGFAPLQAAYGSATETIYDVHSDHLDTPKMLTDEFDVPSWRAAYEAFGKAHVSTDPDGSIPTPDPGITFNLRFPGQYYDAESGLHYNRFRYYAPDVGRYVSADPIGQLGSDPWSAASGPSAFVQVPRQVSTNLYSYVENRPLVGIDPRGLAFLIAGGNANAVVAGGGGVSVGAYIGWHQGSQANQGWFGTPFDAGLFIAPDVDSGLNFGIGAFGGFVKSLTGSSVVVNGSISFYQASLLFNPCIPQYSNSGGPDISSFLDFLSAAFGSWNGVTGGVNYGSPAGFTVGVSNTSTTTQAARAAARSLGF
jgi:RHS repeat-associated protein